MKQNRNESIHATIKEVAKTADVSIATVSRIVNGTGVVSPELTERVMTAMKTLNYLPNDVARSLKIKSSRSIGLVIPDIENPFFPAMVRGVEDAARNNGYAVILCNTDDNAQEEERYIHFLCNKRVDGILFIGSVDSYSILSRPPLPVVLLDRCCADEGFSLVATDNRRGAFLATEYLLQRGRSQIAFIGGSRRLSTGDDRAQGYADALASFGIPLRTELQCFGKFSYEGGKVGAEKLLTAGTAFNAVFAANDMIAIGAIETLLGAGLRIPEDVAVIGYDDIQMAAWYKPALTTIHQPVYEMGQTAVDILIRHISGSTDAPQKTLLQPTLVARQSA